MLVAHLSPLPELSRFRFAPHRLMLKPRCTLRRDGTAFVEVDLAYQCGRVGYIVECKAYSTDAAFLRGDPEALSRRWAYVEEWVGQAVETVNRLCRYPSGDNYALPKDVEFLVPIVCSSNVEPIWPLDSRHMITKELPRICTPIELAKVLELEADVVISSDECAQRVIRA